MRTTVSGAKGDDDDDDEGDYKKLGDNFCISKTGKDLLQTAQKDMELGDCQDACSKNDKCTAVEYYPSKWGNTRCFHMNNGFGADRTVRFQPGRRWRDAQCYMRTTEPGK